MPPGNQSAPVTGGSFLAQAHWLSIFLLAVAFVLVLAKLFFPMVSGWPEALLVSLATISTVGAMARQLPLQNVLLAAVGITLIGGAAHAIGAMSGMPFGSFTFSSTAGQKLFKILPWPVPLVWVIIVLNSRGVSRLILRPWRKTRTYGFWVIGLTAVLTALFDLALDPFASRVKHYWFWMPARFPVTWQGAPLVNFVGWAFVTLLILAFITPALIKKQPGHRSPPDFHPFAVWLGAILLFSIASALHGLWIAAAVDGIIVAVTAVFAIRGARW
jgi:uncharacterized membrane protein